MSVWHPTDDDLYPYLARRMEEAYQQRRRPQCSREDFMDGYLAALRNHLPKSSFKPGRFEPVEEPES